MSRMFGQVADQLLARFVPNVTADAACNFSLFCYCSRGVAYRKFYRCTNSGGTISPCTASGTC